MKKFLLLAAVSLISLSTIASHLMGGEIVVKHDTLDQHTAYIRLYRDDFGIPFPQSLDLAVADTANGIIVNYPALRTDSGFLPTSAYSIEYATYEVSLTLPVGFYVFGMQSCCRNAAILNATNPGSASMQLHAALLVDGMGNSTPDFNTLPALIVPVDTVWSHNPLPFDVNGDSIAWRLDAPLDADTSMNGSGQVYMTGYQHPPSDTTGIFSINPVTGSITWDPAALGNYVASVLVEEYRNGQLIGHVRRDYQFVVIADSSSLRIANAGQIPVVNGNFQFDVNEGSNVNFTLIAENPTGNADMEIFGEPIDFAANPASINIVDNGSIVSGTFDWTPNNAQLRNAAYPVVYRISDDIFNFDFTILYKVNAVNTAIEENERFAVSLYPNPAVESFNIKMEEVIKLVEIYDLSGKLVQVTTGNGTGEMNLSAPTVAGTYIIKIQSPSGIQTLKLSIQ